MAVFTIGCNVLSSTSADITHFVEDNINQEHDFSFISDVHGRLSFLTGVGSLHLVGFLIFPSLD